MAAVSFLGPRPTIQWTHDGKTYTAENAPLWDAANAGQLRLYTTDPSTPQLYRYYDTRAHSDMSETRALRAVDHGIDVRSVGVNITGDTRVWLERAPYPTGRPVSDRNPTIGWINDPIGEYFTFVIAGDVLKGTNKRTSDFADIAKGVLFVAAGVALGSAVGLAETVAPAVAVTPAGAGIAAATVTVPAGTAAGSSSFTLSEIAAGVKTAAGVATSAATVATAVSQVSNAGVNWDNVAQAAKNAGTIAAETERAKLSLDNLTSDPQTLFYIGAAILAVMVI